MSTVSASSPLTPTSPSNELKRKLADFQSDATNDASTTEIESDERACKEQKIEHTSNNEQVQPTNNTDIDMSASTHAEPSGDCTFCCDDLTNENYVEYQAVENGPWLKSQYCQSCIDQHFIQAQWAKYLENIAKADCAAALRRVLSAPPQINVKDAGLPCKDNGRNEEVFQFWYASDNAVHSAKLKDSLEGAARDAFWAEKQAFLTATELQEEITKNEAAKAKAAEK